MEGLKEYIKDLLAAGKAKPGDLLILGCSSSEVLGEHIGKRSSLEVGRQIVKTVLSTTQELGLFLGVQCCEHLNRCIVLEEAYVNLHPELEIVNARPQAKAGGSAATSAYELFDNPVLVERVQGKFGVDIGDTEVGMHIAFVQVPFRHKVKYIGEARLTGLFARPKYIGGERTAYLDK